ncbi:MAG: DNA repair protein RecO [Cyclobacteriaceae bacterium]
MLFKTRAIALSYIRYKESSIIAKFYTELFGIQTYIVNSIRTTKSRNRIALFQPLTLLELVVYKNPAKDIQRISEIKCRLPFHSIPFSIKKSAIALFITELLGKTLTNEEENEELFSYIDYAVAKLDEIESGAENFHLQFMLGLCRYLGFEPTSTQELLTEIGETWYIHKPELILLEQIMTTAYGDCKGGNRNTRNNLLQSLMKFYRQHLIIHSDFKSVQVLHEVLE